MSAASDPPSAVAEMDRPTINPKMKGVSMKSVVTEDRLGQLRAEWSEDDKGKTGSSSDRDHASSQARTMSEEAGEEEEAPAKEAPTTERIKHRIDLLHEMPAAKKKPPTYELSLIHI